MASHVRHPLDAPTTRWWSVLRGASVLNLVALAVTAALAPRGGQFFGAQLACAAIYTLVCAFRSFFPRVDLERTVLVDRWWSNIALGRSAATIAELAFTVQGALLLEVLAMRTGYPWLHAVALAAVPLIALAQTACWTAVLTLDHRWHAVEELLWGALMAALAVAFVASWSDVQGVWAWGVAVGAVGAALGMFVMLVLDVPMYLRRWRESVDGGVRFLGLREGLSDALHTRHPRGTWDVWRPEAMWMTPYFTACVWLSIALVWM